MFVEKVVLTGVEGLAQDRSIFNGKGFNLEIVAFV
jgi:hypothetical protein